jgi:hypothetical protein
MLYYRLIRSCIQLCHRAFQAKNVSSCGTPDSTCYAACYYVLSLNFEYSPEPLTTTYPYLSSYFLPVYILQYVLLNLLTYSKNDSWITHIFVFVGKVRPDLGYF